MQFDIFTIINQFTNIFSWLVDTFTLILSNLNVYLSQVFMIISLLPPFLKDSLISFMVVGFLYMLLRLLK